MKKEYQQFYQNTNGQRQQRRQERVSASQKEIRKRRLIVEGTFLLSCLIVLSVVGYAIRHYSNQMAETTEEVTEAVVVPDIVGAAEIFPEISITFSKVSFLTVKV